MSNILEIGVNGCYDYADDCLGTCCSAYRTSTGITYISDPFHHRILVIDQQQRKSYIYNSHISNWFPRWVMDYNGRCFFVDRNNRMVGFADDERGYKTISCMKVLLSASVTPTGTILICGRGDYSVIELDSNLNIIEQYFSTDYNVQSVQKISTDLFLICDNLRNQVFVVDKNYNIIWTYGILNNPGNYDHELSTPKYACLHGNYVYIADGMNNRIVVVDYNLRKAVRFISFYDNRRLWQPTCIQVLHNNHLLICDSFNKRVIEIDQEGNVRWEYGVKNNRITFEVDNPRIMEEYGEEVLLADSYNNRILMLAGDKLIPFWDKGREMLFWPKSIRVKSDGNILIADSRNRRIIEINRKREIVKELRILFYKGQKIELQDPHDIEILDDGRLIITDARLNMILVSDESGSILGILGMNGEIKDPHQCRILNQMELVISDTGNHQIHIVSRDLIIKKTISETSVGKLSRPRWVQQLPDEQLLVTDSGNNRILVMNRRGKVCFQFGNRWGETQYDLREPRCAILHKGNLYISDTINNRLLVYNDWWEEQKCNYKGRGSDELLSRNK